MGVGTQTAARIYGHGEDGALAIDSLPAQGFVSTYSLDAQTTDSAAGMSAYMTARKVHNDVVSMDATYQAPGGNPYETLLERAEALGFVTGVVTTTRLTHATPASTYGHATDRNAEAYIAKHLVPGFNRAMGDGLEVALGGGRTIISAELPNLSMFSLVETNAELAAAVGRHETKVLGLFANEHMTFELDRPASEPSLSEMTLAAMKLLEGRGAGYVLVVEGGRIDHALHSNRAQHALRETVAFDDAIATARAELESVDSGLQNSTLVATADHDHSVVYGGYGKRTGSGNGILGWLRDTSNAPRLDSDGAAQPIITFGRGSFRPAPAAQTDEATMQNPSFRYPAAILSGVDAGTHSGADVAISAVGRQASRFGKLIDNTAVGTSLFELLDPNASAPTQPAAGQAKNLVLFVVDGMGPVAVTAGRLFKGGETSRLRMESFQALARVKTYSLDAQSTDAAAANTALLTGSKVNNGSVSMQNCGGSATALPTLLEAAAGSGRATGLVTTTTVTAASAAPAYAHHCDRNARFDIATQLDVDVAFGGGSDDFTQRGDARNLLTEAETAGYEVVSALGELTPTATRAIGLFTTSGPLPFDVDRTTEPSLADMAEAAVQILARDNDGFVLVIDASRMDHAMHEARSRMALNEMMAVDAAVTRIMNLVNLSETLVVVTGNHDHSMQMNGYNQRGASVADVVRSVGNGSVATDAEGLPYPVLFFGAGLVRPASRAASDVNNISLNTFQTLAALRSSDSPHGLTDVPLMAEGAGASRFTGTMENAEVGARLKAALGL